MKETQFGFSYSWRDLTPISILRTTVMIAQLLGAAMGFAYPRFPNWFESVWFGGALATFPAFLLGAIIQSRVTPGRLSEHRVMVWRFGLIAFALFLVALGMPFFGFGKSD